MKEFFKFVFASMVGFVLSFVVLILLFVVMVTAIVSSAGKESKADVSANSVLHFLVEHPIIERTNKNPFDQVDLLSLDTRKQLGLNDILASIRKAKSDDHIKGIYLDLSTLQGGLATIEEIRNALLDFKKSGKFILAYSEVYSQSGYYLASVADKVYLNPEGLIDFRGFSSEIAFFKGTLDKLDIEAQVIKVGTFKSAVEPFILDRMSDPNRKQVTAFLGSMYDHFLQGISSARRIPKDSLRNLANNALVRNAGDAVKYKLADGLRYKDQVLAELKTRSGLEQDKKVRSVNLADYTPTAEEKNLSARDRVAVIYANGEIISGEGNDETIGSDRISRAIRTAREDKKVKAVVLRVNSPGGSALASDVIWREVVLTKKVKPIMVSMGDLAASGGYYIACAADSIFAQPNTITGSIGVFGIIPNMKNFFNNKLGITFDGVKTGRFADLGTVNRPLTEEERLIIQSEVNQIYSSFTRKVAEGRKRSQAYIDSIGQGRVWSGVEAKNNGLVDRLGNLDDAVRAAAAKAGLEEYRIVEYPSLKDPFQSLFDQSTDKIRAYLTQRELGESYTYYQQVKSALRSTGIQARLPYSISIR
ncbi:MAG TPA: signal peptide peptidase SppA [Sphingobacteriaceae bacterium]